MTDWTYSPARGLTAKLGRRLTQWRHAAPARASATRAIVSFTFDDFPKSAVTAADIVERAGGRAGFFACTSLAGLTGPDTGDMFDAGTIRHLAARGHEVGAHSHGHIDYARAPFADMAADLARNVRELEDAGARAPVTAFAYPYGETRRAAKQVAMARMDIARGILPGINRGHVDRAQLRAVELGECPTRIRRAADLLEICAQRGGWLIFFSHDVRPDPSRFGVSARQIEDLVARAVDLGCTLAAPTEAARLCGVLPAPVRSAGMRDEPSPPALGAGNPAPAAR